MLKNELLRRVGTYNDKLANISFNVSGVEGIYDQINALSSCWQTESSADTIKYLKARTNELETKIDGLRSAVDGLKNSYLSFSFEEKKSL